MGYSDPPWEFKGKALYQLSLVKVEEVSFLAFKTTDADIQFEYHGDASSIEHYILLIALNDCRQGNMFLKICRWSIFLVGHLVASTLHDTQTLRSARLMSW